MTVKPLSKRHYKVTKFDIFRVKIQIMSYYHGYMQCIMLNTACNVTALMSTELAKFQICKHYAHFVI